LTVKSSHYTKVPKHLNKFSYRKCHWQLFRYQWFNFFKIDEEEVKISAMTDTVNILIVDERLDDIQTLCSALEDPNWNIISALSGVEALKIVQNEEFAVAILDAKILSSGGYKIAKEIHRTEKNKSLPIISVTSLHHQQGMFEGYESGAVDYLFKPIPSIIIRSKVKTFVQLKLQNKLLQQANEELEKALSVGCNEHLTKPLKKDDLQQLLTKFDLFNDSPIDQKKNISRNMNKSTDKFIAILDKSLKNLVPQILEIKRKQTLEIVDAITQCDFEKIQKLGHKLRGSHGLVTVNELGNQLEEAARNKDIEASKSLSNELNEFLSHVEIKFEGDLS